ncbi:M28 family metallopeptidase [Flexivirga caeni]|uniref:M20/M25/M40 family metallo-hydrolase n=1 Tax=Flexivirga caeni TaxID=2294115 RepID=A0A3M9MH98_9MICO|nr:M20/M25/M40 family metallo-hydrolase [Flexivirga caeni]RNI24243.1 M20/M25/M40 family metallo-hydrolase [Flexivirga caeni]
MDRELLESTLKGLAAIGPRPHGSQANVAALSYIEDELTSLGMTVVSEPFSAPAPQLRADTELLIDGVATDCVPFLESAPGCVDGQLRKAPNCLIWGMHDTEVWRVRARNGDTAIIAVPPFPTAVQQHLPPEFDGVPSVLMSRSDATDRGIDTGTSARVTIATPLLEAQSRCLRAFWGDADPLGDERSEIHPIVVAHIDTVPETPGVYDNAAGVAAALSVAATNTSPGYEILITSGEEEGLAGARAFVRRLGGISRLGRLSAAIVLDGGGRGRIAEAWLSSNLDEKIVRHHVRAITDARNYQAEFRQPAPPASDHAAFIEAGVSAVMFTVNDLDILHTSQDTYEESKLLGSRLLAELAEEFLSFPGTFLSSNHSEQRKVQSHE